MWSLRNIYLYLICFVTIMLIITGIISSISSISDIFLPENYTQPIVKTEYSKDSGMTETQYTEMMQKQAVQEMQNQYNRNVKSTVRSLSMIIVAIPFYIYHWRKIQNDLPIKNKVEA